MGDKLLPRLSSRLDERTVVETSETAGRNRETDASTPIHRRSYLKLLGISAVPLAAGRVRASDGTGYGEGGYGEGGYGGTDDGTDAGDGSDDPEPVAPSVVTDPATNVTDSSVTLNGRVTDLGDAEAVDLWFEYRSVGSDAWSATEARRVTFEASCSETVEDLDDETEYEYRALVSSDVGTETGETRSFVTDAAEIGEPVIESLYVEDTSGPNPHVDLEVEWNISHNDDALEEVRIIVRNDNDRLVDGATIDVAGSSASGSEAFRIKHGSGETYVVTLTVIDRAENIVRENATINT